MASIHRLEAVLGRILSEIPGGPFAFSVGAIGEGGGLFAEEEPLIANAVASRRHEFCAGRRCARRALASVGCPAVPLPAGHLRQPVWPENFSGSISHDGRFAVAVAYRSPSGSVRLSVDLIDRGDFAAFVEIAAAIRHPNESPPTTGDGFAIARLFAAKEAAIKIISPAVGDFIDFRELRAVSTDYGFEIASEREPTLIYVHVIAVDGVVLAVGSLARAASRRRGCTGSTPKPTCAASSNASPTVR